MSSVPIAQQCPDGVQYVALDELFYVRRGYTPSKADAAAWVDGTVPWFRMEDLRQNGGILSDSIQKVNESAVKGGRLFPADSLLVATSATIGDHALITVPHLSNQRFTSLSLRPEWREVVDMRFVYYYGFALAEWCRANTTTSSFASVDMEGFRQFRFPVPPLPVQRAIVGRLDVLTALAAELEAELQAELKAREHQHGHYRSSLLTFDNQIPRLPLGSIATIGTGSHDTQDATADGEYVFYARGRDPLRLGSFDFDERAIITAGDGAGVGKVFHFADGKYALHQRAYRIVPHEGVDPRFLYHYLAAGFADYLTGISVHSSVTSLRRPMLLNYPVAVPPMAEQQRVAQALDRLDALLDGLGSALSAEVVRRRQQHQYYRGRLLSFPERVE